MYGGIKPRIGNELLRVTKPAYITNLRMNTCSGYWTYPRNALLELHVRYIAACDTLSL